MSDKKSNCCDKKSSCCDKKSNLCEKILEQPIYVQAGVGYFVITLIVLIIGIMIEKTLYQTIVASYGALIIAWIAYNGATATVNYQKEKDRKEQLINEKFIFPNEFLGKIHKLRTILLNEKNFGFEHFATYPYDEIIKLGEQIDIMLSPNAFHKYTDNFVPIYSFKKMLNVFILNNHRIKKYIDFGNEANENNFAELKDAFYKTPQEYEKLRMEMVKKSQDNAKNFSELQQNCYKTLMTGSDEFDLEIGKIVTSLKNIEAFEIASENWQ